ncbi:hypothetical protein FACS1894104_3040 [Actinomycetota bacterium]|nr:hypothetical protein FACS1894104_3040 [Actinomycetota bacterium]
MIMNLKKATSVLLALLLVLSLSPAAFAYADQKSPDQNTVAEPAGDTATNANSQDGNPAAGSTNQTGADQVGTTDPSASDDLSQQQPQNQQDASTDDSVDKSDGDSFDALSYNTPIMPRNTGTAPQPGTYLLRSAISHIRVIDISGGSLADYANVQLYHSNMTPAQQFDLIATADGFYALKNTKSGLFLDVAGAKTQDGTNVWQHGWNNTPAQKWSLQQNSDGSYALESAVAPGKYLDVAAAKDANNANIQIWHGNATPAQNFHFIPLNNPSPPTSTKVISTGLYSINNIFNPVRSFDVPSATTAEHAALRIWNPNNTPAQTFYFQAQSNGLYSIRPLNSGHAFAARDGNLVATTHLVQVGYNPTSLAQLWAINDNGDGTVSFVNAASGLYLDITGGSSENGTGIQLYKSNSTPAQKFRINPISMDTAIAPGVVSFTPITQAAKRIDIPQASQVSGTQAQVWNSNKTFAQKFNASLNNDGSYSFSALSSGQYLSDANNLICQIQVSGVVNNEQKWRLIYVVGGTALQNVGTGRIVDLSGNVLVPKSVSISSPFDVPATAAFTISRALAVEEGYYVINSAIEGKALDVEAGSLASGANVRIWTPNGTGAQIWKLSYNTDGSMEILNAKSFKALDVASGDANSGANVQQWNVNGTAAQKWTITPSQGGYFNIGSLLGTTLDIAGGVNAGDPNVIVASPNGSVSQNFKFTPTTSYYSDTMLNGVDVSAWQPANIGDVINYDFMIVKATEGTYYTSAYYNTQAQSVRNRGKLLGFYHFAGTDSPEVEAQFFVSKVRNYVGSAALILDYEADALNNGREWVRRFMREVKRLTGVTCGLYCSSSYIKAQNLAQLCDEEGSYLWNANYSLSYQTFWGYRQDIPPAVDCRIYQYTSSGRLPGYSANLDLNVFYGSQDDWLRLCRAS